MAPEPKKERPPVKDWMSVVIFDGKGDARRLTDAEELAPHETPAKGFVLVTGNARSPEFRAWLDGEIGKADAEMLQGATPRARCIVLDDKALVLLALAGETDADEHGRQFMALWIEARRVIVVSEIKVLDLLNIEKWQRSHHAPLSAADLVARLGLRFADRIEPMIERMGDHLDRIEEGILTLSVTDSRKKLGSVRHNIIGVRRLIWPQRDVLDTLEIEDLSFLTPRDRTRLREGSSRLERLGVELQALSERAVLVHEQILDTRAEQMNKIMLLLTAVTVILLPLTVITGMLGMNVAGIPYADSPYAFWVVCVALVAIGALIYGLMRKLKWL
jgi:zinc transporter